MPEIKHNFTGGKMNKDVDQRLVPKGEYRDAMNIQVSTSEGSDVGTVQNILGNKLVDGLSFLSPNSTCVGAIADEKNDAFYWLVASQVPLALQESGPLNTAGETPSTVSMSVGNYILEHKNNTVSIVFADLFYKSVFQSGPINQTQLAPNLTIPASNHSFSVGDIINEISFTSTFETNLSLEVVAITVSSFTVDTSNLSASLISTILASSIARFVASPPGVLRFNPNNMITGINIIDDLLFWTDGTTEPKKINIPRCIEGTDVNGLLSTKLIVEGVDKGLMKERHITVIRTGPSSPPSISSVTSFRDGTTFGFTSGSEIFNSSGVTPLPVGSVKWIAIDDYLGEGMSFQTGDILRFSSNPQELAPDYYEIRASVLGVEDGPHSVGSFNATSAQTAVKIEIESMSADGLVTSINPAITDWNVGLEEIGKALFERKLPRFSTRYKYSDGEYSTIGPFTEVVFIPGDFRYHPSEAYNTGMVNKLRELTIQDFIPSSLPEDVIQVDILYKNEVSPNIYTVESISKEDALFNGVNAWTAQGSVPGLFGSYKISSENIYATLSSNQLLRGWDSVPTKALAQEITGNRLVYGNYTQNHSLKTGANGEIIKPNIQTTIGSRFYEDSGNRGKKSIKSMRTYDVGLAWGDKYGRETPIITPSSGSTIVPKAKAARASAFNVEVDTTHPDWAEYYKIFIKETSNEYYNLAMDRMFDASDGNVWVSFPSIDRNKVDEDTYIILKKGIDTEDAIAEEARYKIVAIENEAPEFIKTSYNLLAESVKDAGAVIHSAELYGGDNPSSTGGSPGNTNLPSGGKNAPIPGVKGFSISIDRWTNEWFAGNDATNTPSNMGLPRLDKLFSDLKSGSEELWVDFTRADDDDVANPIHGNSERYRVTQLLLDDDDQDYALSDFYEIKIHRPITTEDSFITEDLAIGNDFVGVHFWKKSIENSPMFDGRFFVKILRDSVIDDNLINYTTTSTNWTITSSTQFHRIKDSSLDKTDALSFYQLYQPLNSYPSSYPNAGSSPPINNNSTTRTEAQWKDLLKFGGASIKANWFIDGASFASVLDAANNTSELVSQVDTTIGIGGADIATSNTTSNVNYTFYGAGGCAGDSYITSSDSGDGLSRGVLGMKGAHSSGGNNYFDFAYSVIGPDTSGTTTNFTVGEDDGNDPTNSSTNEEETIVSRLTPNQRFRIEGDPSIYRIHSVQKRRLFNWRGKRVSPGQTTGSCNVPCTGYDSSCGTNGTPSSIECVDYWAPCCDCIDGSGNNNPMTINSGVFQTPSYNNQSNDMGRKWNRRKTYRIRYSVDTLSLPNPDLTTSQNGWSETLPTNPAFTSVNASGVDGVNGDTNATIQFLAQFDSDLPNVISNNPAIFETEPKEDVDLDIYYEATSNIPTKFTVENRELHIPIGATLDVDASLTGIIPEGIFVTGWGGVSGVGQGADPLTEYYVENIINLSAPLDLGQIIQLFSSGGGAIRFYKDDESFTEAKILYVAGGTAVQTAGGPYSSFEISITNKIGLGWFNCWSFNNGVESNRIGDTYNKPYITNGVKASSVAEAGYEEEQRTNGLIYSGIYNSNSGTNNLNQFITADKITKDLNPIYGGIQKLYSGWGQGGDLIALCEDRILKILANKDALYNADGNANVTSTNNVLGQAIPYSGEYGISKNPESFASEAYRVYFTDKVRGTVMRLSMDGLTPISNHGMKDWFRDKLKLGDKLIGSYDDKKDEYNITIKGDTIAKTVTFKEDVKGWVSFKSFTPEKAISCANEYYTFLDGRAWKHHDETQPRNTFYDHALAPSTLEVVFNEVPGSVKSFKTINYEGSQAKVTKETGDNEYFNLSDVDGWYVENIVTNLEQGGITEFVNKEGKWFGYVTGNDVTHNLNGDVSGNYYTEDFSIQGVGRTISAVNSTVFGCTNENSYNYNPAANQDDGSCVAVVYGCLDPNADNYYPGANVDDDSCVYLGCTTGPLADWNNQNAGGSINYDPNATQDDGSCITAVFGCTDSTMFNYNNLANVGTAILSDGTNCGYENCACIPVIYGCTDSNADNYITLVDAMQDVNTDDGSCIYNGCTDPLATNYDFANSTVGTDINGSISYVYLNGTAVDDGSCTYPGGCTDSTACNYDSTPGMVDNGSCQYCGDDDAVNYDGAQDTSCTTNCTYCEQPVPLTISAQATSDANMNNGSVTLEWAKSTSATIQYYEITINNGSPINVNPSGNATETHTINNLAPGTYDFQVIARCTQTSVLGTVSATPIFIQTHITVTPVLGCTDDGQTYSGGVTNPAGGTWGACNYYSLATQDDGSCEYTTCTGCNDPLYIEYCGDCWDTINQVVVASNGNNWVADTIPTSCLTLIVYGCTDATAFNYDPLATVDDGSCVPVVLGCMDSTLNNNGTYAASNYAGPGSNVTPEANTDDGSCLPYTCPIISTENMNNMTGVGGAAFAFAVNSQLTPYSKSPTEVQSEWATGTLGFTADVTVSGSNGSWSGATNSIGATNWQNHHSNSLVIIGSKKRIQPQSNFWIAGDTTVTVDFNLYTNDGNCTLTDTNTYSIGCTDNAAANTGAYDITDDSQCVYPGCTDSTPSVMNSSANAATNYDANATVSCGTNNNNGCCTYHDDQDLSKWTGGGTGYWMASIVYEPESTGYTEAVMSTFTMGEAPGSVLTVNNVYPMSGMTTSFTSRAIGPINPYEWEPYVYNDQLKITANADFDGACDNNFLNDQLPTGSVNKTFNFSVGCKDDNTAINYDPNVDLGMASTCIAANPGCMDSTATNYSTIFNQDCTFNGSANPNDCCCYTCGIPTFNATNPVVVNTWDNPSSPVYATQITFNFAAVSTAASYTIFVDGGSTALIPVVSPTINNGIVSYTFNTTFATFQNESTYKFIVRALCENNDGDSCGHSDSADINILLQN